MTDQPLQTEANLFQTIWNEALRLPFIRVNRDEFLQWVFVGESETLKRQILLSGPVLAGIDRKILRKIAEKRIEIHTLQSSALSFVAGLPGGIAGAALGITGDTLQFFAAAMRMAQEIAYLYGERDLWNGADEFEEGANRLTLFCGAMFGVGVARAAMRGIFCEVSGQLLKKLPRLTLSKSVLYPVAKRTAQKIGLRFTKGSLTKGIAKAVPIVGGLVSGGMTAVSLPMMGRKLLDSFDYLCYEYSEEERLRDLLELQECVEIDIREILPEENLYLPK